MKKLLIWGAGDQGLVTLECALAMNAYEQIDFLEIKDPETERRPPVFFQIQEQWSLSDTLPIDKDSNRNKNGTRNKKRKRN